MNVGAENIWLSCIVISGAMIVMIYGLNIVYKRIKSKNQGFGQNTIKAIAMILIVPTILILAVLSKLEPQTLAALIGAVAGYTLSYSSSDSGGNENEK
jgi:hypothetical protein